MIEDTKTAQHLRVAAADVQAGDRLVAFGGQLVVDAPIVRSLTVDLTLTGAAVLTLSATDVVEVER